MMRATVKTLVISLATLVLAHSAIAAESAGPTRPIDLKRVVVALEEGQAWGTESSELLLCKVSTVKLRWRSGRLALPIERLSGVFSQEGNRLGIKGGDDNNLFQPSAAGDRLQAGALIKNMNAQICFLPGDQYPTTYRGTVDMTIEWQVFDPLRQEVVAKFETVAQGEQKKLTADGLEGIIMDGFRQNARAFLQREDLRALTQKAPLASSVATVADAPITLASSPAKSGGRLADAVGSVVLVQTDGGHGSGFLVSADGYLLTNAHVVGDAKVVRIRWSDGYSATGDVVRLHKGRDIALIKTSPHSRPALPLRPGLVEAGEAAYAIGAPLDEKFQGTLTRGVVSATRIYGGLSFIQSDVTVNPGNSGGPLLDDKGRVIAITDLGYQPDGVPTGINLFIPIGDALDFLNLKQAP